MIATLIDVGLAFAAGSMVTQQIMLWRAGAMLARHAAYVEASRQRFDDFAAASDDALRQMHATAAYWQQRHLAALMGTDCEPYEIRN